MTASNDELRRAMERISQSMVREIKRNLVIESELPPLPPRDDPHYEAIAAWHLGHSFLTMHRHPDLMALRKPEQP